MLKRPRDVRERRRHARDQGPVEAGKRADRLVVNGVLWVDVTRLRRRESLMLVMQDGQRRRWNPEADTQGPRLTQTAHIERRACDANRRCPDPRLGQRPAEQSGASAGHVVPPRGGRQPNG
jgi:hypothetical protein